MFKRIKYWRLKRHIMKHWGWKESSARSYANYIVYGYEKV